MNFQIGTHNRWLNTSNSAGNWAGHVTSRDFMTSSSFQECKGVPLHLQKLENAAKVKISNKSYELDFFNIHTH